MPRAATLPISVRKLAKSYGSVRVLDDIDLDVRSGELLTLLGPSGSGKTTLLMVLAGFTRPDRGSILFGDTEVIRLAPHKRNVGMVFQSYALFPHMTVAGNIGFPLRLRGVAKPEAAQRVERALETVQLAGYGTRRIEQLSGGQRQRVAFARAIVFEPDILLMDEPLSALDKQLREHMQIELRRLHDKLGVTTVYVTHDQREALTMSDRVAVIDRGRIMQLDTPRRLYERPANRFVAGFIGDSTFLPVDRFAGGVRYAGQCLKLPDDAPPDGACTLLVRPERLRILDGEPPEHLNVLRGTVQHVVYQGDSVVLQVLLADGASVGVRATAAPAATATMPKAGAPVLLGLDPQDTTLLADDATAP